MYPKPLQKLIALFARFPGIGPKQATRFAFFVLKENHSFSQELMATLREIKEAITICNQCFRTMSRENGTEFCSLCRDPKRDQNLIIVVEKESDLQNLEKTGAHQGLYHVLGGVISTLDSESPKRLRLKGLYERVKMVTEKENSSEVILATNPTTEGDTTALYIEKILSPLREKFSIKISRLGRGLSLGSELEYADENTLKNALTNRK